MERSKAKGTVGHALGGAALAVAICIAWQPAPAANAATLYAIEGDCAQVKVPASWKSFSKRVSAQTHSSGAWQAGYALKGSSCTYMRIEGSFPVPPQGRYGTTAVIRKSAGRLTWELAGNGGSSATIQAGNVVLRAWNVAHGKAGAGLSKSGKASLKKAVKVMTGGKCTYARAAKLSKARATKLGRKAIYRYVGKNVVPNVKLLF